MKLSRIFINAFIIYICIAIFFAIMELMGLADQIYLRLINFAFVIYGVNRTIKQNYKSNTNGYFTNLSAAFFTALLSGILAIVSFTIYAEIRGGEAYIDNYSRSLIFGGDPSLYQFTMGLFLEAAASSIVIALAMMQIWKDKVDTINTVDDINHNNH